MICFFGLEFWLVGSFCILKLGLAWSDDDGLEGRKGGGLAGHEQKHGQGS